MTNTLILPQNSVALAMVNPLAGPDHEVATWFHTHLTGPFVTVVRAFTEFGSSAWIGTVLFFLVVFFIWKRWWPSLVTLIVAVPGGMLLNELLKTTTSIDIVHVPYQGMGPAINDLIAGHVKIEDRVVLNGAAAMNQFNVAEPV